MPGVISINCISVMLTYNFNKMLFTKENICSYDFPSYHDGLLNFSVV